MAALLFYSCVDIMGPDYCLFDPILMCLNGYELPSVAVAVHPAPVQTCPCFLHSQLVFCVAIFSFLAAGGTMKAVAESYRIGFATIRKIIPETCRAIWTELGPDLMALPTPEQWRQHALDYQEEWQFPNCVGAIDGKHVMMEKPANSGSINYNYKGFCSIVLMAVADAKCRFRFISVGSQESDGGVWGASALGEMLEAQETGAPRSCRALSHFPTP